MHSNQVPISSDDLVALQRKYVLSQGLRTLIKSQKTLSTSQHLQLSRPDIESTIWVWQRLASPHEMTSHPSSELGTEEVLQGQKQQKQGSCSSRGTSSSSDSSDCSGGSSGSPEHAARYAASLMRGSARCSSRSWTFKSASKKSH